MMARMVNGKGMAQDMVQDLEWDLDPGWKIWILRLSHRYHTYIQIQRLNGKNKSLIGIKKGCIHTQESLALKKQSKMST